jgi:hypothetical protein
MPYLPCWRSETFCRFPKTVSGLAGGGKILASRKGFSRL